MAKELDDEDMIEHCGSTVDTVCAYVCSFPLILNIESHCSIKQQQTMAYYMQQVFGNKLYIDAVDVNARYLPSPESLRRKILIKVAILSKLTLVCALLWRN